MILTTLKAPFPWFGGKSRVAETVWDRFGNVSNYVEPFFGSGAVLLGRPSAPGIETVNDKDCYVANFWRALRSDPEGLASLADWPVNEADLHARHLWLVNREGFRERMKTEPKYFDLRVAAWWVWGIAQWIGSGWCAPRGCGQGVKRQRPHLGDAGQGVNRKRPHLGDAGRGVNRQRPHLGDAGASLAGYFSALAERLRRVRVCCGDWARVCGPTPTFKQGLTGVFLDPPYTAEVGRDADLYATEDSSVGHEVCAWAVGAGENPLLRIAVCGYEGEYEFPEGWECVAWKVVGGYGSQADGAGRANCHRERIWFSPHCLRLPSLWELYI